LAKSADDVDMSGAFQREQVWSLARRIATLHPAGDSRFAAFDMRPLQPEPFFEPQAWLLASASQRTAIIRRVAAAALARQCRASLDGALLKQVAAVIGEASLDQLLTLPEDLLPQIDAPAPLDIDQLGGALLLAGLPSGAPSELLQKLLPGTPEPWPDGRAAILAQTLADAIQEAQT
jgi:hypothetical protein